MAENPFEAWDCEPPLLTYYGGRHGQFKVYQDAPESWWDFLRLLPAETWQRGKRVAFLKEFILPLGLSLRDFAEEKRRVGEVDAIATCLGEHLGDKPEGWRSALEWFELAKCLLKWAGIPCLYEQSNGYSQGDSTLCLVVLTPEWLKKSGANLEHADSICKSAINLYSSWAWGDVYGYQIKDENGESIEYDSCWGFYGSDHEASGLLESAKDRIDYAIQERTKEAETLEAALFCSV